MPDDFSSRYSGLCPAVQNVSGCKRNVGSFVICMVSFEKPSSSPFSTQVYSLKPACSTCALGAGAVGAVVVF